MIISHKPNVFRPADKILLLRDGRVELFGPRDQVMARVTSLYGVRPTVDTVEIAVLVDNAARR